MSGDFKAEWTRWFIAEFRELPADQKARVAKRIRIFEEKGWDISAADDDIKRLTDRIWELRVVGKGPAYRLLFFPDPAKPRRVAVLTSCVRKGLMKKGNVGKAEIQRAEDRRVEWLRERR